jgi:GDPmannose 4,6-dehydratase
MKKALICGVSGQDGAYLARLLLGRGYAVHGSTRSPAGTSLPNLERLGVATRVTLHTLDLGDTAAVHACLDSVAPDEVYCLAGQSSVGLSFEAPAATQASHTVVTLNLLEAIRRLSLPARYYNACSSECFGDTGDARADEQTPFSPLSPYASSKVAAHRDASRYREEHGLHICTGILFNHESPLRPEHFVTRKVVAAACRIAGGSGERLQLGNLSVTRDWGWAPEYVEAIWRVMQAPQADDYVIATGHSHTLRDFVATTFAALGLDWQRHVSSSDALLRPAELLVSRANPAKAREHLGWEAKSGMKEVIAAMIAAEREFPARP